MNIFLQGPSGAGKSHLLRETLTPYAPMIAGFTVQRLFKDGERVGFRAVTMENRFPPQEAEYDPGLSGIFILRRERSVSALEEMILRVEDASRDPACRLVLIDEIGGIELTSPVFMGSLKRILAGPTPCTGVFKCRGNLTRAVSVMELEQDYFALHGEVEDLIRESGELIDVTEQNRTQISNYVKSCLNPLFSENLTGVK
jgi:nucleoside-triphosphatase THEP1